MRVKAAERADDWVEKFIEAYKGPEITLDLIKESDVVIVSIHVKGSSPKLKRSFSLDTPPSTAAAIVGCDLDTYSAEVQPARLAALAHKLQR